MARRGAAGSDISGRAFVLVAIGDAALAEIVGRHFHGDAITGQRPDAALAHLASGVGDDLMAILQLYAETTIGQYLLDQAIELQEFFLCHTALPKSRKGGGMSHAAASDIKKARLEDAQVFGRGLALAGIADHIEADLLAF